MCGQKFIFVHSFCVVKSVFFANANLSLPKLKLYRQPNRWLMATFTDVNVSLKVTFARSYCVGKSVFFANVNFSLPKVKL